MGVVILKLWKSYFPLLQIVRNNNQTYIQEFKIKN